jgi:hypothetical protein
MQIRANHDRPPAMMRCLQAKRSRAGEDRGVAD